MQLALTANMKMCYIDGSFKAPIAPQDAIPWKMIDAMNEVKARYEGNNGPTLYRVKKDICTTKQDNLDLEEYYSKVCSCDKSQNENCVGCKLEKQVLTRYEKHNLLLFLMGLDDSYENLKDNILVMDPLPSEYKAFTMFLNVESKNQINRQNQQSNLQSAMTVRDFKEGSSKRFKGNDGRAYNNDKRRNFSCTHYNMKGHSTEGCYRLIGFPDWWDNNKRKNAVNSVSFDNNDKTVSLQDQMKMMQDMMKSLIEENTRSEANMYAKNKEINFEADFKYNLISVTRLITDEKVKCIFSENGCLMQGPEIDDILELGKRVGNLYFYSIVTDFLKDSNSDAETSFSTLDCKIRHYRCGHPSNEVLRILFPSLINNMDHCKTCQICKSHRLPFHNSTSSSKDKFDLVQFDI
ncbi:uncharacterized protein LOC124937568 [Impatiens glandulifera]|uniref:uncharacterized protein LOC124937568 n=1 Tax=Impatiens glandulifera TaxID=253017 RepID=UPI001FB14BBE|nr:uncharacterized protein LOC124937568 [Impatiens glandulifera]